jgi:hypothetical protein
MEAVKAFYWKCYLQLLFVLHLLVHKKAWIDNHIILCYTNLDKLDSNYDKSWHNKFTK